MSARTDLLATVDAVRAIAGPAGLDVIPSQLTIRVSQWASGRVANPTNTPDTITDLTLPQIYEIVQKSGSIERTTGGKRQQWTVTVGPITPSDGISIGFRPNQLKPADLTDGMDVTYVITGEFAGVYRLSNMDLSDPFGYMLTLERQAISP